MTLYKPAGFPPWTADCSSGPETPPLESVSATEEENVSADETLSEAWTCLYSQSYFQCCVKALTLSLPVSFCHSTRILFFSSCCRKHWQTSKQMDFNGLTLRLCLGLVGAPHHWTVYGADAVVAHVQRCQVSPHRDESRDRTAGLRPLSLPLWELARLRDQDGLEADTKMTRPAARHARTQTLQPSTQSEVTIIVSVDRWMLRVARLDLRDDRPSICWELHSLIWGQRNRQKV